MGLLDTLFPIMFRQHVITLRYKDGDERTPPGDPAHYFMNRDKLFIYWRQHIPSTAIKGVVFLAHGAGEHSGRYEKVVQFLNTRGYAVFTLDHQGHGLSEGDRMHVEEFDRYIDDVFQLVREAFARHPHLASLPRFMFGHSMGGLIAVRVMERAGGEGVEFSGLLLSGPALKVDPKSDNIVNRSLAPLLSRTIPKWKVVWEYGPVAPGRLTSDKACEEAYFKTDKLIYHGALKVRWAWELLCATDTAIKEIGKIQHPLIIQHGSNDQICLPEGSQEFIDKAANAKDKTLRYVEGGRHEIMNEPDPTFSTIMETYGTWLDGHLVKPYLARSV